MDIDHLPYVPARLYRVNPGRPIDWIIWHDMEAPEGPETAENVSRYFQSLAAKGSAHICVDNNSCVRCVLDEHQAAHAPGANTNGLGVELAGYARQTRAEWLDPFSLDVIDNAADCAAQWHHKWNIPPVYRNYIDLRNGLRGWSTHWQVSLAFGKSTHTDPGTGFPLDYTQARIDYYYHGEDEMGLTPDESKKLDQVHEWSRSMWEVVVGTDVPAWGKDNPRHNSIMTRMHYLFSESLTGDNTEQYRALLDNAIGNAKDIDDLGIKLDEIETALKALNPSA